MGYYLEPQSFIVGKPSKQEFCELEGVKLPGPEWPDKADTALVCLMWNGRWWAAGVCYSKREMDAFNTPEDGRQRTWYWLPKEKCYESMAKSDSDSLKKTWNVGQYETRMTL
jgi:hypothetical protein